MKIVKNVKKILFANNNVFKFFKFILIVVIPLFLSYKANNLLDNANDLIEKQLLVMKAEAQPVFNISSKIRNNDIDKDYIVISVDNTGGTIKNFDIMIRTALFINFYFENNRIIQTKPIIINDMFYGIVFQRNKGVLKEFHDNGNFKKYLDLRFQYLNDNELKGYLNLKSIVRIVYNDIFNEEHIEYYEINETQANYLSNSYGEKIYNEFNDLDNNTYFEEINIDYIKNIISNY